MITGPPEPRSISATRRTMSARMIFSPICASATSSARSWSGGMRSVSTSPIAVPCTNDGRPASCPTSAMKWPRSRVRDDVDRAVVAVARGDVHAASQQHEHSRTGLADLEEDLAGPIAARCTIAAQALDLGLRQAPETRRHGASRGWTGLRRGAWGRTGRNSEELTTEFSQRECPSITRRGSASPEPSAGPSCRRTPARTPACSPPARSRGTCRASAGR